jgi:hypothetical protein
VALPPTQGIFGWIDVDLPRDDGLVGIKGPSSVSRFYRSTYMYCKRLGFASFIIVPFCDMTTCRVEALVGQEVMAEPVIGTHEFGRSPTPPGHQLACMTLLLHTCSRLGCNSVKEFAAGSLACCTAL